MDTTYRQDTAIGCLHIALLKNTYSFRDDQLRKKKNFKKVGLSCQKYVTIKVGIMI